MQDDDPRSVEDDSDSDGESIWYSDDDGASSGSSLGPLDEDDDDENSPQVSTFVINVYLTRIWLY